MTGQQVYQSMSRTGPYHFQGRRPRRSQCTAVFFGLDLSTATDAENVATAERCQRDGCRQQWAAAVRWVIPT